VRCVTEQAFPDEKSITTLALVTVAGGGSIGVSEAIVHFFNGDSVEIQIQERGF